jgi:hypothetical protein
MKHDYPCGEAGCLECYRRSQQFVAAAVLMDHYGECCTSPDEAPKLWTNDPSQFNGHVKVSEIADVLPPNRYGFHVDGAGIVWVTYADREHPTTRHTQGYLSREWLEFVKAQAGVVRECNSATLTDNCRVCGGDYGSCHCG